MAKVTSWRPVTIPTSASPDVQLAVRQLNENGRLLAEAQLAAIADLGSQVLYIKVTGGTSVTAALGTYEYWGTYNGMAFYKCQANSWYLYWHGDGTWIVSQTFATHPTGADPTDRFSLSGFSTAWPPYGRYTGAGSCDGWVDVYEHLASVRLQAMAAKVDLILADLRTLGLIAAT